MRTAHPLHRTGRTLAGVVAPVTLALATAFGAGCAWQPLVGPLTPLEKQDEGMEVFDDGSVVYRLDRFEVTLQPMTDEELNRQFPAASEGGIESTNPYTYGDLEGAGADSSLRRFTVFRLEAKNYAFPKVRIDPALAEIETANGRRYQSLSLKQLETYFRAYTLGYRGNAYARHRERMDLLRRTMFDDAEIFSGQERSGYLVFRRLHGDVHSLTLTLHDVELRFDYRGEPVETTNITYAFDRLLGRQYASGRQDILHDPQAR